MKVGVVGRGKVGCGLFARARDAKVDVSLVAHGDARTLTDRDLIVLAVPDAAIETVAAELAQAIPPVATVHCAGARSREDLRACASAGFPTGVMHPLLSFASKDAPPFFEGSTFVIAGSLDAIARATEFATSVGARPLVADIHGPAYHAAAALTANGAVALAHAASRILFSLHVDPRDTRIALAGLLRSVADNLARHDAPSALTGPIARGDGATVRAHRNALSVDATALASYDAAAKLILMCAVDAGLSPVAADEIRAILAEKSPKAPA